MLQIVSILLLVSSSVAMAITNGQTVNRGAFPQVVLIENHEHNEICTGVLVGENTILTAHHCIFVTSKDYLKISGQTIAEFIVPAYEMGPESHLDIALIKLSSTKDLGRPIEVDCSGDQARGNAIRILGYGLAYQEGLPLRFDDQVIKRLGQNKIHSVNNSYINIFFNLGPFDRTATSGALPGDSGGPMLNEHGRVIGIASQSRHGMANYMNLSGSRARTFLRDAAASGWDIRILF